MLDDLHRRGMLFIVHREQILTKGERQTSKESIGRNGSRILEFFLGTSKARDAKVSVCNVFKHYQKDNMLNQFDPNGI